EKATEWLNDIMKKATFEAVNDKGQARYFYDGMTVITDDVAQTIITVYSNREYDFLKLVLVWYKRNIKRHYTTIILCIAHNTHDYFTICLCISTTVYQSY